MRIGRFRLHFAGITTLVVRSELTDQEEGYAKARDAMLADLAQGYPHGTQGTIAWSRDSLHER
jgi:hypothetical protein